MSEPSPTDYAAVTFLVDSSLAVASEWNLVLKAYIAPMIRRLSEVHSIVMHQFRVAIVIYSTADTRPSPVITRRYFSYLPPVTKELREKPGALGLGRTVNGGGNGMAALEGLVATIELFDTLKATQTNGAAAKNYTCHIFHIAAGLPNAAIKPMWNKDSTMDDVKWESLPGELIKRNINYSIVSVRQVPQFVELHEAVSAVQPLWFPVKPPHTVLLAGFSPRGQKRTSDNAADLPPDPKRARLSQSASSDISPSIANNDPPKTTSPSVPPHPQMPPKPFHLQLQQFAGRIQRIDKDLQQLDVSITDALAKGDMQEVEKLKKMRGEQLTISQKGKEMFAALRAGQGTNMKAALALNAAVHGQPVVSQFQPPQPPAVSHQEPSSGLPSIEASLTVRGDVEANSHLLPGRAGLVPPFSLPNPPQNPPLPQHVTTQLAAQMQKMMEQQHRSNQSLSQSMPGEDAPGQAERSTPWQGVLTWTGSDALTGDAKAVRAHVMAIPQGSSDLRPEAWPAVLQLKPQETFVPRHELLGWLQRNNAAVCRLQSQPHARGVDPKTNESYLQSLVQILTGQNRWAVAAWSSRPSDPALPKLLLIPSNNTLIGAAFPLNGIPDLPKSNFNAANPLNPFGLAPAPLVLAQHQSMHHFQNIQNMSNMQNMPNIQNMQNMQNMPNIQNMPLESRNQFLQLFRRQQMSQAARVQQAQQMNAANNPNVFSANQQLPGLLGEGHGHGVQFGVVPPHPMGGGGFVQSSGVDTVNMGYEVIHSYMQRNGADASGSGSN